MKAGLVSERAASFPLLSHRRAAGLSTGSLLSLHRGPGTDIAGSRPYRPGDDMRLIDRHASARLSAALGTEEFVVREHFGEVATAVVVLADRRPSMGLYPPALPWLDKPRAVAEAVAMIAESALRARCRLVRVEGPPGFDAPEGFLAAALEELVQERALRAGSFVFVLSDFLALPDERVWEQALERGWDVVPVVVQDPTWEQSFPEVWGAVLPLADPTGRLRPAFLRRREALARRRANEERLTATLGRLEALGLDPVLLSSADPEEILERFQAWAEGRRRGTAWLP